MIIEPLGQGTKTLYILAYIYIYLCSVRLIPFKIWLISKEISWAEYKYMNMHPPPPPPN